MRIDTSYYRNFRQKLRLKSKCNIINAKIRTLIKEIYNSNKEN